MRIPSAEETAQYFSRYGLQISSADLGSSRGWKVVAPNLPLDGRSFPSLGALWLEWMDYAAERLSIESKVKRFVSRFESSSPEGRKDLLTALANYPDTSTGPLEVMFEGLPQPCTDHLPETWQSDFDQIWNDRKSGFCFAARAEAALDRLLLSTSA
ncbi:hypothetical protein I5U03_01900 [Stenotrophomonas maltophilia]|uniref:hypothetical protein n=1 Tax=Stenotrophomonas TaxID=40323 RepID=UPI0013D9C790|nr:MULTISPECIES: hypothetical protein [Stenotrophomonas]EKT4087298.1 hypothetical protein [Stenotrophomonas maltophilia]MBH1536236.1 hypothetical protein [Stenotrophomonas maltophilia]